VITCLSCAIRGLMVGVVVLAADHEGEAHAAKPVGLGSDRDTAGLAGGAGGQVTVLAGSALAQHADGEIHDRSAAPRRSLAADPEGVVTGTRLAACGVKPCGSPDSGPLGPAACMPDERDEAGGGNDADAVHLAASRLG
jgi:hypothetical protein